MHISKNTNEWWKPGDSLCLCFFWTIHSNIWNSPRWRFWSTDDLLMREVVKNTDKGISCISYLSCHLFELVHSFGIKQHLSSSSFTVLVNDQANLIQVKLWTGPTVGQKRRKKVWWLQLCYEVVSQSVCLMVGRKPRAVQRQGLLDSGLVTTVGLWCWCSGSKARVWEQGWDGCFQQCVTGENVPPCKINGQRQP